MIKTIVSHYFDDDALDSAIGRNGMNVNLASKITDYKIDAYGVKQYERIQEDQNTKLLEIEGVDSSVASALDKNGISVVSDLLDSDMDKLLTLSGVDEDLLDSIYEAVQSYIEREVEPDVIEEEVDLSSLGINLEYEENENSEEDRTSATLEEE